MIRSDEYGYRRFCIWSFLTIGGVLIFVLATLGIYAAIVDINKNTNDYQKCICQK